MEIRNSNARIIVESVERKSGTTDFTTRLHYERARGKKRKPEVVQLCYRFDPGSMIGKFTSWPKKWDTGIRGEVETKLSHYVLSL